MCSCCRMSPHDVKVMRQRQGAVEIEDFEDEVKYRHPKRRAKKSRPRSQTRMPCPESEDGKHVYVWEPYRSFYSPRDNVFLDYFGYAKREVLTCCGCMATKGYGRETDKYLKVKDYQWRKRTGGEFAVKRGEPLSRGGRRWGINFSRFNWEDYHEGYQKAILKWEQSKEAKDLEHQAALRRIKFRMEMLGYSK